MPDVQWERQHNGRPRHRAAHGVTPVLDAETVLTTLYCWIDDALKSVPQRRPVRPGRSWRLSDSEVLTLGVLAQFVPHLSERAWLRYVTVRFPGAFARLPDQSGYNRHLHDLWGVLAWLGPALARRARVDADEPVLYQAIDGTGVSLLSMRRGTRGRVYGDGAALGRGGVDRTWFYGVKLAALVDDQGWIHGCVSGPANTEERFLAEGLWRFRLDPTREAPTGDDLLGALGKAHRHGGQRQGPTGPLGPCYAAGQGTLSTILADDGYGGAAWQTHWHQAYDATVVTRTQAGSGVLGRWFSGKRHVVESTFSRLHGLFALARPRTKHLRGWWLRLSAKVAAHNTLLRLNAAWLRPLGAHLDLTALP